VINFRDQIYWVDISGAREVEELHKHCTTEVGLPAFVSQLAYVSTTLIAVLHAFYT